MEENTPKWLTPKVLIIGACTLTVLVAAGIVLYRRKQRAEFRADIDELKQWWEAKHIKNDDLATETKPHVELKN
jgi:cell division protein FtsL